MLTIEGSASLNLVKEQIDESLSIAESNLEQFVEEPENEARLKAAIEQFALIKGVFKLINLPGASLLSEELEQLGHKILAHHDKNFAPLVKSTGDEPFMAIQDPLVTVTADIELDIGRIA